MNLSEDLALFEAIRARLHQHVNELYRQRLITQTDYNQNLKVLVNSGKRISGIIESLQLKSDLKKTKLEDSSKQLVEPEQVVFTDSQIEELEREHEEIRRARQQALDEANSRKERIYVRPPHVQKLLDEQQALERHKDATVKRMLEGLATGKIKVPDDLL